MMKTHFRPPPGADLWRACRGSQLFLALVLGIGIITPVLKTVPQQPVGQAAQWSA